MEHVKTIALSLNDIVFENRNKNYGAYQIRQAYENHLSRATMIGVAMFALALAAFWFKFHQEPADSVINTDGILEMREVVLTPPPPVIEPPILEPPKSDPTPPAASAAAPVVATVVNRELTVTTSDQVDPNENPPTQDELANKVNGSTNTDGPPATDGASSGSGTGTGIGGTDTGIEVNVDEVINFADKMPEYEGGQKAMAKFFRDNMRVPSVVGEKEISGTVYVGFVVNNKGEVTDVKILKGIHPACDNEAIRVVSKMKKWIPGQQAGRNVSVRYTIPIRFDYQRM